MNQSNVIFAFLFAAFIVFITMRGKLRNYLGFILGQDFAMPFALVLIGLLMIVVGSKNTYREFGAELAGDFSGPGNFTYWIGALGAMGAMGYVPALRNFSRLFMALILIAMVLSNRGFFQRLTEAFELGPVKPGTSGNVTKVSEASQPNQNVGAAKNDNGAQASNTEAQNNFMTVMQGVKLLMGVPG